MNEIRNLDDQERFAFGKNWANFLKNLNEDRIKEAEKSLLNNLKLKSLKGKTFLDIGSGSGLFSLAAHRLGAKVFSFDYDKESVGCTNFLKENYAPNGRNWTIEQGSILDTNFLKKLRNFDIVYSWGVLHHTGHMYNAFSNIVSLVKNDGVLFISIYNDQGRASCYWEWIKKTYNDSSRPIRFLLCTCALLRLWTLRCAKDFVKTGNPLKSWKAYGKYDRGMSAWHDVVDWTGGYPFEVAKPEEVFEFFNPKGFELKKLKTCAGGIGCNEFVFQKKK